MFQCLLTSHIYSQQGRQGGRQVGLGRLCTRSLCDRSSIKCIQILLMKYWVPGCSFQTVYKQARVLYMLAVGSWVTWFFTYWERMNCLPCWRNSKNDNYFNSKWSMGYHFDLTSYHFLNLLNFARSFFFFLSLKKSQLPIAKNKKKCRAARLAYLVGSNLDQMGPNRQIIIKCVFSKVVQYRDVYEYGYSTFDTIFLILRLLCLLMHAPQG